jgi:hypothetical protein
MPVRNANVAKHHEAIGLMQVKTIGFGSALHIKQHVPERLTGEGRKHSPRYLPTHIIKASCRVLPRCRHGAISVLAVRAEMKEWLNLTLL